MALIPRWFRPLLLEKFSKKSENRCHFFWSSITYLIEKKKKIVRVTARSKRPRTPHIHIHFLSYSVTVRGQLALYISDTWHAHYCYFYIDRLYMNILHSYTFSFSRESIPTQRLYTQLIFCACPIIIPSKIQNEYTIVPQYKMYTKALIFSL